MTGRFMEQLRGKSVVGAAGRVFGELADLEVDLKNAKISGVILTVPSSAVEDLGLKKPFWRRARLTLPTTYIESIGDVILLNISMDEYGNRLQSAQPEPPPRTPEALG